MRNLLEKFSASKSRLMREFLLKDPRKTGKIVARRFVEPRFRPSAGRLSVNDWCEVVSNVLDLKLPWRTLRARLAESDIQGNVLYESTFRSQELQCSINASVVKVRNAFSAVRRIFSSFVRSATRKSLSSDLSKQRSARNGFSSDRSRQLR